MPRALDLNTKTVQRLILKTVKDVQDGEIDTKKGNTMISGYRAILYGNHLKATEERIEIDRRLAENMEQLNSFISRGGTFPAYQEVEKHEETEL